MVSIDTSVSDSVYSGQRYSAVTKRIAIMVYTLEEVADILKVSVSTVRRLIKEGQLKTVRVRTQLRVTKEELDRFLKSQSS